MDEHRYAMKKVKYYYNTSTLRYEKLVVPLRVKLLRVLGFIASALVTALIIVSIAFKFIDSPKEKIMRLQYNNVLEDYGTLNQKVKAMQQQMADLEKRDNQVYRSIFEANPIPDSARARAMAQEQEIKMVESMEDNDLGYSIAQTLNNLSRRMSYQNRSYDEISKLIDKKEDLLAGTPAIQPVSNKDLSRVASGFGYRIDPVYKTTKFHAGLDFAAPQGTPIYATADGIIKTAGNKENPS